MFRTILIVGASRGIGAAAARHFGPRTRRLIAVSRTPAVAGEWLSADLATDAGLDKVTKAVGDGPLDALLYLGGTWEQGAFTESYRFLASPTQEIRTVIAVNLIAPILLCRTLAPALRRAPNPRIVLIGALSGRDGGATPEVANTASKFGLRGAAQALSLSLHPMGIGVTVINPGNVATPEVECDIAEGRLDAQVPIPVADLLATLDHVLALGPHTVPAEIDLAQKHSS
ncbi:MAG: SDR family NAD(P)-dependent oxidoreductase [Roseinatronobacter sp.]